MGELRGVKGHQKRQKKEKLRFMVISMDLRDLEKIIAI